MLRRTLRVASLLSLPLFPLIAQAPLPMGTKGSGTATTEAPATFRFTPAGPGVLTVVVKGSDDMTIRVVDGDGQVLPDGTADNDVNGSTGLEFLALPVGYAEPLVVEVAMLSEEGGGGKFTIAASFVAEDAFARAPDPDRRPSTAKALTVGAASEETLNADEGDSWDWFKITANEAMTLVIVTRMAEGTEGDLTIATFTDNDFATSVADSDQDLQGHTGNESVTVDVKAGQTVHVKVASLFGSGGASPYRISVGRVP
jgi:hypothetical protein